MYFQNLVIGTWRNLNVKKDNINTMRVANSPFARLFLAVILAAANQVAEVPIEKPQAVLKLDHVKHYATGKVSRENVVYQMNVQLTKSSDRTSKGFDSLQRYA